MKQFTIFLLLILTFSCMPMKTSINKEKTTYDYPGKKSKAGRKLIFETTINAKAEEVWQLYQKPSGWLENLSPQAKLIPRDKKRIIEKWIIGDSYSFVLYMYGFIPFGKHHISFEKIDPNNYIIQSREHGFMVPHWDNYFQVIPLTDTTCRIKDVLTIQTMGMNSIVATYAVGVFKAKHKKLAQKFK